MSTSTRSILRGERADGVGVHAFMAVDELPRTAVDRPLSTGDPRVDAIRGAAWDEGVSRGAAEGHREGFERGLSEGFEQGRREGLAAGAIEAVGAAEARIVARVEGALAALDRARHDLERRDGMSVADIERGVVDLALGLASTILQREVAASVDPGADALRRALELAPARGHVVARLAPDDVERLADLASIAPGRPVEIVADPTLSSGGCIVEVGSASIDASIEGALARARSVLQGELEGGRS